MKYKKDHVFELEHGTGYWFVYIVGCIDDLDVGPVKIGHCNHALERTVSQIQRGNPRELKMFHHVAFSNKKLAYNVEKCLHRRLDARRTRAKGEWFNISPADALALVQDEITRRETVKKYLRDNPLRTVDLCYT